jgi:hypothetical protein
MMSSDQALELREPSAGRMQRKASPVKEALGIFRRFNYPFISG